MAESPERDSATAQIVIMAMVMMPSYVTKIILLSQRKKPVALHYWLPKINRKNDLRLLSVSNRSGGVKRANNNAFAR